MIGYGEFLDNFKYGFFWDVDYILGVCLVFWIL